MTHYEKLNTTKPGVDLSLNPNNLLVHRSRFLTGLAQHNVFLEQNEAPNDDDDDDECGCSLQHVHNI